MRRLIGLSRTAIMVALVAALALSMFPSAALAAKGGRGGSGGSGGSAALTVWQNGAPVTSAAVGSVVDVKCSGMPANTKVYVGLMNAELTSTVTDASGSCSVPWALAYAGGYNFQVGILTRQGYTIYATAPLSVG